MSSVEPRLRTVRLPRLRILWAYAGGFAAWLGALLVLGLAVGFTLPVQLYMLPIYFLAPVLGYALRPALKQTGTVVVSRDGVTLDGEAIAQRARLGIGMLRREGDERWLRLAGRGLRRGNAIDVAVEDEEEAGEILRMLGLDAKSTTSTFELRRVGAGRTPLVAACLGGALGLAMLVGVFAGAHLGAVFVVPFLVAAIAAMVTGIVLLARSSTSEIVVGADGLLVRDGLGARRFVSHDRIAEVSVRDAEIVVSLRDGSALRWSVATPAQRKEKFIEEARRTADGIAQRIREARAAFEELSGEVAALPALARSGRSTADWLSALRRVGEEGVEAGFRDAGLSRDRLWRVAEATQAPELVRLSAAVALAKAAGDEERERLRALAERSASPKLQARIRVAVEGKDDAALAQVLEELEEEAAADGRAMER